jgi:hypothetical protein
MGNSFWVERLDIAAAGGGTRGELTVASMGSRDSEWPRESADRAFIDVSAA